MTTAEFDALDEIEGVKQELLDGELEDADLLPGFSIALADIFEQTTARYRKTLRRMLYHRDRPEKVSQHRLIEAHRKSGTHAPARRTG
jgi:hypothetical protein